MRETNSSRRPRQQLIDRPERSLTIESSRRSSHRAGSRSWRPYCLAAPASARRRAPTASICGLLLRVWREATTATMLRCRFAVLGALLLSADADASAAFDQGCGFVQPGADDGSLVGSCRRSRATFCTDLGREPGPGLCHVDHLGGVGWGRLELLGRRARRRARPPQSPSPSAAAMPPSTAAFPG